MEEQFITYEIALKLKELGFDSSCFSAYTENGKLMDIGDYSNDDKVGELDGHSYYISCLSPLWQQVIDWFLSQYNIWIIVDTSLIKFYKNDELQPSKFQFVIEDLNNRDADYMFHSADEELFYFDYKHAREQAILKALELCHK